MAVRIVAVAEEVMAAVAVEDNKTGIIWGDKIKSREFVPEILFYSK